MIYIYSEIIKIKFFRLRNFKNVKNPQKNFFCLAFCKIFFCAFFLIFSQKAFCQIEFLNPTINSQNQIIFCVDSNVKGSPSYRTAFCADAKKIVETYGNSSKKIISCFPEKMEWVLDSSVLQIRNRYGIAHYNIEENKLRWVSLADEIPSESNRIAPYAPSPNGKWLCFIRKTTSSSGQLILKDVETFSEVILNDKAEFSYEKPCAKWAADSSAVVYEKDGFVCFCAPTLVFKNVQLTEEFRKIGRGNLNSVFWHGKRTLIFAEREIVYVTTSGELFARSLYSNLVGIGEICARLPFDFNPQTDRFWISPDGTTLFVASTNCVVSAFKIDLIEHPPSKILYTFPFTDVRGTILDFDVFWDSDGFPIIWTNVLAVEDAVRRCSVYRIGKNTGEMRLLTSLGNVGKPVLSPDGKKVAFSAGKTLFVYDVTTWKISARLNGENPISYLWQNDDCIFVGGSSTVRQWFLNEPPENENASKILFLSSVQKIGWAENGNSIFAQCEDLERKFFKYDEQSGTWALAKPDLLFEIPSPCVQNGRFRVFVGPAPNPRYKNSLFIRNLIGKFSTIAAYPKTVVKQSPRQKIALIFDAMENADCLSQILSTLEIYDVPATFFLNGEFIRRYAIETRQICERGYECASLFFTPIDFTKSPFIVDEDFITRGLARNEDDFFAATGRELSLLWHAPFYRTTAKINAAAKSAGYFYADAYELYFDTEKSEYNGRYAKKCSCASDAIEKILSAAHGQNFLPISVGRSEKSSGDALCEKLDLLISALLDSGYEFVLAKELVGE